MNDLTPQERQVLDYITQYRKDYGYNPTHVAIAESMTGVKKDTLDRKSATAFVKKLKDKGYLIPTGRFGDYKLSTDEQ